MLKFHGNLIIGSTLITLFMFIFYVRIHNFSSYVGESIHDSIPLIKKMLCCLFYTTGHCNHSWLLMIY